MKRQPVITTCFAAALFTFATAASAQQFNGEPPANGACFYDEIGFGGQYVCVKAGEDAGYINELNDHVSSIRVFGNAKVVAYEDAGFRGATTEITKDMPDLRDARWNDVISSVKVTAATTSAVDASPLTEAERVVNSAYQDLLGRDADVQGLRAYSDHLAKDGWTADQVRNAIRSSPEVPARNRSCGTRTARCSAASRIRRRPTTSTSS